MILITISGPQSQQKNVAKALKDAGYSLRVTPTGDLDGNKWGWDDDPDLFLTVEHDDPNVIHAAVQPFGWRQRAMHDVVEFKEWSDPYDTPVQKLARLGLTPADMREILGMN